jgi:aryl-alcohol dehydrogenase-like predicted oxidoreductase
LKFINFNNDKISKLALGSVSFGLDYGIANNMGQVSKKNTNNIVDIVYDSGINTFDSAMSYGNSEDVLGYCLDKYEYSFVITKIKSNLFIQNVDLYVQQSIDRLKVDRLGALLLHDSDILYNLDNLYNQDIDRLKQNNKIKYFGISIYDEYEFDLALNTDCIDIIQIPFSILDIRAIKYDWIQRAKQKNKLLFIRSIFLQGLVFLHKEDIPDRLPLKGRIGDILEKVQLISKQFDIKIAELSMRFVYSFASDSVMLFGCECVEQAVENIDIFDNIKPLVKDEQDKIINTFDNMPHNIYNPFEWKK